MKIAFFSPVPYSEKLGATKNRIEFSQALDEQGCETFLLDREEIGFGPAGSNFPNYCEALKTYLIHNAHRFDIVIYEYNTLPYKRELFPEKPIFIARPALLGQHEDVKIPKSFKVRIKDFAKAVLSGMRIRQGFDQKKWEAERNLSLSESDLIQVQNNFDANWLIDKGFKKNKILIVPNGISKKRLPLFKAIQKNFDRPFKVAFVGTFDFRKGAMDFPYIIERILENFPDTEFKLLGTKGLFITKEQVLKFFPKKMRPSLTVIPSFEPMDLPILLSECHVGIFPSYYESFGFGALEMMCAGLPVVAYKSAGPADYILEELLVDVGDKKTMAEKVTTILANRKKLIYLSEQAARISEQYNWEKIAIESLELYRREVQKRNKNEVLN